MSLESILDRLACQPVIRRRKKLRRSPRFFLEGLESRAVLNGFTVNSTIAGVGGDGANTLLEAIGLANADTGDSSPFVINFDIPTSDPGYDSATGVSTIKPLVLPAITHPVIIDGTTQPGYTLGHPLIDIDGSQAGNENGLTFNVGGNTVKGLIINNFQQYGIDIDGTNDPNPNDNQGPGINNTIEGNFIGTDPTGEMAAPNGLGGIEILNSSYNLIGGLNTNGQLTNGNLVSGNGNGQAASGIFLDSGTDSHNYIEGNYIGTDVTGLKPIQNAQSQGYGVSLVPPQANVSLGYASNNFIGDFDPVEQAIDSNGINIIGGNTADGVLVVGGSNNQISGNYIGIGADGTTPVANGEDGVLLQDASKNVVGGTTAGSGNVISGNLRNGITIDSAPATEYGLAIPVSQQSASFNTIAGNLIGTDVTGKIAVPNGDPSAIGKGYGEGILLKNEATDPSVFVTGNVISGFSTGHNVISGNWDDGILMAGANVTNNTVAGNYIGTDITGQHPLGNSNFGMELTSIAGQTGAPSGNIIGTTDVNGRNLISGNGSSAQASTPAIGGGIGIVNGPSGNTVQNNLIGTDISGRKFVPNAGDGVRITAANGNTVGGDSSLDLNVIGGNVGNGISIVNGASANKVQGNSIGTNLNNDFLPNDNGVFISNANGNTIGGDSGSDENVIGANEGDGVLIANAATGNYVEKNSIGVSLDASTDLPNLQGIALVAATGNYIGNIETVNGQQVGLGNVISANSTTGIDFSAHADSNYVLGNMIGTDATGELNLGNGDFGILINDSSGNQIGGTTTAARNLIVFNNSDGIDIESDEPVGNGNTGANVIEGDYIGIGPDGLKPEANSDNGILINNSSSNVVGSGTIANVLLNVTAFNVISDNGLDGVQITGQQSQLNVVAGNYIGLTADGTTAASNGASAKGPGIELFDSGVVIKNGASSTTVGGGATGLNVISGNQGDGIFISSAGSNNIVQDNYIGTNALGSGTPTGATTQSDGVVVDNAPGTTIGAASFDQGGNVISGNQADGIFLDGPASTGTKITGNYIGTDKAAATPIGNGSDGIKFGTGTTAGTPGPVGDATVNTTVDGNTIAGNLQAGIALLGGTTNIHITNNYIGTNSDFIATLPNYGYGVFVQGSPGNFIGTQDAGNQIYDTALNNKNPTDTGGYGILITGEASTGNDIADNNVKNNATAGIQIDGGASSNKIGITQGNVIGGNVNGIVISDSGTQDNTVDNNDVGIDPDDTVDGNTHDGIIVTGGARVFVAHE